MRLLEPGRKRRGRTTAYWLWLVLVIFVVMLLTALLLR
jgi:hypothetical protein